MLAHRLPRRPNIDHDLGKCMVFIVYIVYNYITFRDIFTCESNRDPVSLSRKRVPSHDSY